MFDSQVEEIKNRLDIVEIISSYIRLQKSGRNYSANCPFHNEKTPSFMVSPEKQIWHCFGCNDGGDVFSFVMKIEGVEFGDVLKLLAPKAGIVLKKENPKLRTERQRFYEICEYASKFFEKQLWQGQKGKEILSYLRERGLKDETIKDWRIGYAPETWSALLEFLKSKGYKDEEILRNGLIIEKNQDSHYNSVNSSRYFDRFRNRVMFPIKDLNSQIVAFTGRIDPFLKEQNSAKYINSPQTLLYDKSRILYGLNFAKLEIKKQDFCILVEGNVDVIMSHQAEAQNAVATSGTALTIQHLQIIKRYTNNIFIAFDSDKAGDMATKRGIDLALQNDFNIKIIQLSEKDPADLIKSNSKEWQLAVENAQEIMNFYFKNIFSKYDSSIALDVKEKRRIAQILLEVINKLKNKIEQSHWIQELGRKISVDEKILWEQMKFLSTMDRVAKDEINDPIKKDDPLFLLEKRLAGLLLLSPQKDFVSKLEINFFSNQEIRMLIEHIKKEEDILGELTDFKEQILTQFEQWPILEKDINAELELCYKELTKRIKKSQRNDIQRKIKLAEASNDNEQLNALLEKFINLSKD